MTRRFVASAVVLWLSSSSLISAQQDTAKRPAPKKPDLELTAARQMDLDTDEGTWISLDVSPDGRTIVFGLLGDLYTMPITGGPATALTNGQMYDAQRRFSPDGKSIVFTSDRNGGDNGRVNPLDNIRNTNSVRFVMKNGRIYDGNTLDEIYPRQRKMEPVLGVPQAPVVKVGIPQP